MFNPKVSFFIIIYRHTQFFRIKVLFLTKYRIMALQRNSNEFFFTVSTRLFLYLSLVSSRTSRQEYIVTMKNISNIYMC